MSNGIPMFISEFDSLDSTDNETLYTQIKEMSELDSRFTMIVVNKADNASLDPDGFSSAKIKAVLNWSIPKNLYSEGIYFVSSIMGLGAKNNGKFQDEYYDDIFCAQEDRYKNPKSRHKKSLVKNSTIPAIYHYLFLLFFYFPIGLRSTKTDPLHEQQKNVHYLADAKRHTTIPLSLLLFPYYISDSPIL